MVKIDWTKVPQAYKDDILDYVVENRKWQAHGTPEEFMDQLEPKDAFHYWLQWNGIIGYTETILDLAATLGVGLVRA